MVDNHCANVKWSVIVPSHNGADTLAMCLPALGKIKQTDGEIEIILVDNASDDETLTMFKDFAERSGAVVLSEPRRGKSYALNSAIERAAGEILVFLDDDIIADADLIKGYATAERDFPEALVFAGQVRPHWLSTPPGWLRSMAEGGECCGCTPATLPSSWVSPSLAKGGNIAIRRGAIGASRFDTGGVNFGASSRPVGGEDSKFVRQIARRGGVRFVHDAIGSHIIMAAEQSWGHLFSRYLRIGRGNAAQGLMGPAKLPLIIRASYCAAIAAVAFICGLRMAAARSGLRLAMQLGAVDYLRHTRNL